MTSDIEGVTMTVLTLDVNDAVMTCLVTLYRLAVTAIRMLVTEMVKLDTAAL